MTLHTQLEALEELEHTNDPARIEALADGLDDSGGVRATRALVWRLGDSHVQDDPDVEDAVCGALVSLGVMRSSGNQRFAFLPRHELPDGVAELLHQLETVIPMRYRTSR
jgi:hypothetical protein